MNWKKRSRNGGGKIFELALMLILRGLLLNRSDRDDRRADPFDKIGKAERRARSEHARWAMRACQICLCATTMRTGSPLSR